MRRGVRRGLPGIRDEAGELGRVVQEDRSSPGGPEARRRGEHRIKRR